MSINATTVDSRAVERADVLVLVGRLLLASLFIPAGFAKLTAIGGTAAWFGSLGLPMPTALVVLSGLLELLGGVAILVGYQTRLAAIALAIFTLAATAVAHVDFADQMQLLLFQKNLALTGGFLALAAFGAGRLSLDGRRAAA